VPAAAVIPAPKAYVNFAVVKKLVVGFQSGQDLKAESSSFFFVLLFFLSPPLFESLKEPILNATRPRPHELWKHCS